MPDSLHSTPSLRQRVVAGSTAGVVAAAAYGLEHEWDLRAFHYNADDFIMLGRLITNDPGKMRWIGLGMHVANGAIAGCAYALFAHDQLPGSPRIRGITFALAETAALYPLALIEDVHPAIREGRIARYLHSTPVVQNLLRHVAFGAVVGPLTSKLLNRMAKGRS